MKILIWSYPYQSNCNGIKVLHKLCHDLRIRGYPAYVTDAPNPDWDERVFKEGELDDEDTIVIYPEVVHGNPLNAKYVIRYILNNPGLLGGDTSYSSSEIVICYNEALLKYVKSKDFIVTIFTLEQSLFNTKDLKVRSGGCYYLGKSKLNIGHHMLTKITRTYPATRKELAALLKSSEFLICYDNFTQLIDEARLCGCPVYVPLDGSRTKEDVCGITKSDAGLCFHLYDLWKAEETVKDFEMIYANTVNRYPYGVDNIIQIIKVIENRKV